MFKLNSPSLDLHTANTNRNVLQGGGGSFRAASEHKPWQLGGTTEGNC